MRCQIGTILAVFITLFAFGPVESTSAQVVVNGQSASEANSNFEALKMKLRPGSEHPEHCRITSADISASPYRAVGYGRLGNTGGTTFRYGAVSMRYTIVRGQQGAMSSHGWVDLSLYEKTVGRMGIRNVTVPSDRPEGDTQNSLSSQDSQRVVLSEKFDASGKAISTQLSDGSSATYTPNDCGCVVGECSFEEFSSGAKRMTRKLVVDSSVDGGFWNSTTYLFSAEKPDNRGRVLGRYKTSFDHSGRLLDVWMNEEGVELVLFRIDG